jgi:hypothetical protein
MLRQLLNTVRTVILKTNTFLITLWHRAGNVADGVSTLNNRVMEYVYRFRGKRVKVVCVSGCYH